MQANSCYYEVLGILPSADLGVIRTAYRSLAQHFHPDKNPEFNDATVKMQQLNEAYRVLSNARSRKAYDDSRRRGRNFDPDHFASEPVQTRSANEQCNTPSTILERIIEKILAAALYIIVLIGLALLFPGLFPAGFLFLSAIFYFFPQLKIAIVGT